jgi:hypothetical protein
MAEIVGRIDPQVLAQRQDAARIDRNVKVIRAIHEQKKIKEWRRRIDEAKVAKGKFNQIKMGR